MDQIEDLKTQLIKLEAKQRAEEEEKKIRAPIEENLSKIHQYITDAKAVDRRDRNTGYINQSTLNAILAHLLEMVYVCLQNVDTRLKDLEKAKWVKKGCLTKELRFQKTPMRVKNTKICVL